MLLERDSHLSPRCSVRRNILHGAGAVLLLAGAVGLWGVSPALAQDPGTTQETLRSLTQERDRLLDEVERLRSQIRSVSLIRPWFDDLEVTLYPPGALEVVVKKGDTFQSLVRRYTGDLRMAEQVMSINPGLDPTRLKVGQIIALPPRSLLGRLIEDEPEAATTAEPRAGVTTANETENPFSQTLTSPFLSQSRDTYEDPWDRPILNTATLQLLTQATDLVGELEDAEKELEHMNLLKDKEMVTERMVMQAKREVTTLLRKRQLFTSLIESEVESVEQELDLLKERRDQYVEDSQRYRELQFQMQRAARRIELLMSVR